MKKLVLLLMILSLLVTTACWDMIDIEKRAYVLGVAIDLYPPNPKGREGDKSEARQEEEIPLEKTGLYNGRPEYALTVQIPILQKAQSSSFSGGGGDPESDATWQITQIGNSFISMNLEMATRTNLIPYYEHLQAIILSEDVARAGLKNVIDFFVRDPEMGRRVNIYVSHGEAKKVLDVNPRTEDYSSIYLSQIHRNTRKTSRMVEKAGLNKMLNNIDLGLDFILPAIQSTKDEIKSNGAAIFKKDKMVGWLDELELEAVKFILNRYNKGLITVTSSAMDNAIIALDIGKSKTKIKTSIENDLPRFDIDIEVSGSYAENTRVYTQGDQDIDLHKTLEKDFEKEIVSLCENTIKKMQEEYGVDIFEFKQLLRTREPAYWKEVKNKWEDLYPKIIVKVKARVKIDLIGLTS